VQSLFALSNADAQH